MGAPKFMGMVTSEVSEEFGWSVLLVDDVKDMRGLVRLMLERTGRLHVVGEAADGREALELAKRLQPDAVILDLNMPVMDGFEALPRILEVSPRSKVIIHSGIDDDVMGHRLTDAAGYIVKGTASAESVAAEIIAILEGND